MNYNRDLQRLLEYCVEHEIKYWPLLDSRHIRTYIAQRRLAELISINVGDIDLDEQIVPVTGKGSKTRILPMGRHAISRVKEWMKVRQQFAAEGEIGLFVSSRGTRLSVRSVQQRFYQWGQKQTDSAGVFSSYKCSRVYQ